MRNASTPPSDAPARIAPLSTVLGLHGKRALVARRPGPRRHGPAESQRAEDAPALGPSPAKVNTR
jgi:hypothetical protein